MGGGVRHMMPPALAQGPPENCFFQHSGGRDRRISEFEASLVCREFQDSQGYTEKLCLGKPNQTKPKTLFLYWVALSSIDRRASALSCSILFYPVCCLLEACSFLKGIGAAGGGEGRQEAWKERTLWSG